MIWVLLAPFLAHRPLIAVPALMTLPRLLDMTPFAAGWNGLAISPKFRRAGVPLAMQNLHFVLTAVPLRCWGLALALCGRAAQTAGASGRRCFATIVPDGARADLLCLFNPLYAR